MSVRNQAMTRAVQTMLEQIKAGCFNDDYQATDTEAMGLLLSHVFDYDGIDILKVTEGALEDANYHDAAAQVGEIRTELESPQVAVRVFYAPSDSRRKVTHTVTLGGPDGPTCTCEDFLYRHNTRCKHILNAQAGVYGKGMRGTVVPR